MKQYIEKTIEQQVEKLMELIGIPSVYDSAAVAGGPFGKGVKAGLDYVLKLAETMGFETKNYDGYAGEITCGKGEHMIGILCHVDVVAGGSGWTVTEPFKGKVFEGSVYGRGAMDDKGPLISSLYAMKYMQDNGLIPEGAAVRMIVGTNEEESWEGIAHYLKHAERLPDKSIVPDGSFPVIFCEKGLLDFDLSWSLNVDKGADEVRAHMGAGVDGSVGIADEHTVVNEHLFRVLEITGGSGRNVVPASAMCRMRVETDNREKAESELARLTQLPDIQIHEQENGEVIVTASGRSAHCMSPEKGKNAIGILLGALSRFGEGISCHRFVEAFQKYIGMDYYGGSFGCGFEDELSGKLTFNVGTILMEEEGAVLAQCNIRYPASMPYDEIKKAIAGTAKEAGFGFTERDYLPPVCFEKDSSLIKCLMTAYSEATCDAENKPIAIGGATYARAIPNAVAFGPVFPHEEELAHEPDECLSIESMKKMTEIYIRALSQLLIC